MEVAERESSSIACESCRVKKCKCDRALPSCSQCVTAHTDCRYPRSSKRGIPTGYISSLESRLLETETALFEVLSHIHAGRGEIEDAAASVDVISAFTAHASDISKSERSTEWQRLPLSTPDELQSWWQDRSNIVQSRKRPRLGTWSNTVRQLNGLDSHDYAVTHVSEETTFHERASASTEPEMQRHHVSLGYPTLPSPHIDAVAHAVTPTRAAVQPPTIPTPLDRFTSARWRKYF